MPSAKARRYYDRLRREARSVATRYFVDGDESCSPGERHVVSVEDAPEPNANLLRDLAALCDRDRRDVDRRIRNDHAYDVDDEWDDVDDFTATIMNTTVAAMTRDFEESRRDLGESGPVSRDGSISKIIAGLGASEIGGVR